MDGELTFDGAKYISSKRASEIAGYAQDYIGQLCRTKKLISRRVGRSWYVQETSLISYINGDSVVHDGVIKERDTEATILDLTDNKKQDVFNRAWEDNIFSQDQDVEQPQRRPITSKASATVATYTNTRQDEHFFRNILIPLLGVSAMVVFVVLMGFASGGVFNKISLGDLHSPINSFKNTANALNVFDSLDEPNTPEHPAYTRLPFFMAGYAMISSQAQLVDTKIASDGGLLGMLSTSTSGLGSDILGARGIYITPSQGLDEDALVIQQIANTFSDEVTLTPNKDGQSGLIRPIFRESKGDEYLYVLVPIDN